MDFTHDTKVSTCLNYVSDTAVRNGAILDMAGFEGVMALAKQAAIHNSAVGDIFWQQGNDSGLSDAAALAGTAIAIGGTDDDKLLISDLYRPTDRYVRLVVTKDTTNAQAESILYIQYGPHKAPVTTGADTAERHVSPAEGAK